VLITDNNGVKNLKGEGLRNTGQVLFMITGSVITAIPLIAIPLVAFPLDLLGVLALFPGIEIIVHKIKRRVKLFRT
jgi:hypothetical protein